MTLGLHELAVEDALEPHQRPKLDHYASHLFLSVHAVQMASDDGELRADWLETARRDSSETNPAVDLRRKYHWGRDD